MGFWIFMFCCTLLIPIIMIIAGNSMRLGKFKTINSIVGYRTRRSMKNQQTWDYAHGSVVCCGDAGAVPCWCLPS